MRKDKIKKELEGRIEGMEELIKKYESEGKDSTYFQGALYAFKEILKGIKNYKFG